MHAQDVVSHHAMPCHVMPCDACWDIASLSRCKTTDSKRFRIARFANWPRSIQYNRIQSNPIQQLALTNGGMKERITVICICIAIPSQIRDSEIVGEVKRIEAPRCTACISAPSHRPHHTNPRTPAPLHCIVLYCISIHNRHHKASSSSNNNNTEDDQHIVSRKRKASGFDPACVVLLIAKLAIGRSLVVEIPTRTNQSNRIIRGSNVVATEG